MKERVSGLPWLQFLAWRFLMKAFTQKTFHNEIKLLGKLVNWTMTEMRCESCWILAQKKIRTQKVERVGECRLVLCYSSCMGVVRVTLSGESGWLFVVLLYCCYLLCVGCCLLLLVVVTATIPWNPKYQKLENWASCCSASELHGYMV